MPGDLADPKAANGKDGEVLFEATWYGSFAVNEYTESHDRCPSQCGDGVCVETSTHVDRIDSPRLPSGFIVNHRCENLYHVYRVGGGPLGAPGLGFASQPTAATDVRCYGTFVLDLGSLETREDWSRPRLALQVMDPAKAEAFRGEEVEEDESEPPGGEGLSTYRNTWTWNLVREPD